jgi:hypothetical protein
MFGSQNRKANRKMDQTRVNEIKPSDVGMSKYQDRISAVIDQHREVIQKRLGVGVELEVQREDGRLIRIPPYRVLEQQ